MWVLFGDLIFKVRDLGLFREIYMNGFEGLHVI